MEQIVGVWRGEAQGWAAAPVPEFLNKSTRCWTREGAANALGESAWRGEALGVQQFAGGGT